MLEARLGPRMRGTSRSVRPGLLLTLLHNDQVEGGEVGADNATADGLATALALTAAVAEHAGVTGGHEQPDALVGHDTLAHGETLLVLAAHDLEDVALELLAEGVALDLLGKALVKESTELAVIVNLDLLLGPSHGVGNIELHG